MCPSGQPSASLEPAFGELFDCATLFLPLNPDWLDNASDVGRWMRGLHLKWMGGIRGGVPIPAAYLSKSAHSGKSAHLAKWNSDQGSLSHMRPFPAERYAIYEMGRENLGLKLTTSVREFLGFC